MIGPDYQFQQSLERIYIFDEEPEYCECGRDADHLPPCFVPAPVESVKTSEER